MYKIWRSIYSDFSAEPVSDLEEETCHADEIYTDEALHEIAENGFNAIWVHCFMHHIAAAGPLEMLAPHAEEHQKHLQRLCERAKRHGIKVFLYAQPFRALPEDDHVFWDKFGDTFGGSEFKTGRTLCISSPPVREWFENLSEALAASLPELGGLIAITASEYSSHCYNIRQRKNDPRRPIPCPYCGEREPEEVVADVLTAIRNGFRRVSSEMEVIAWDWSWSLWHDTAPFAKIVDRLPPDIAIMADFERGGHMDFWRHPGQKINEYCLTYAGPSEDCRKVLHYANSRGMKTLVKLQLGTTHELASVVSLPLITNIYQKIAACKEMKIDGFMGCWNFGNFYSANTACTDYFLSDKCPDRKDEAIQGFIRHYFGKGCDAALTAQAYQKFADSMTFSLSAICLFIMDRLIMLQQKGVFMQRVIFSFLILLLCAGCASSDRMARMSGGVLEEYSVPKSSRLRSAKFQQVSRTLSPVKKGSKMVLAGMDDTLINIWPFFFRNNAYWSVLWPLVDKDPYGFAFRPFYNQEGDEYSILFPLSAWNPAAKNGWVALFGWNKTGFGLVPLFWHWKEDPYKGGGYYTPLFFHTYNNTPFLYKPRKGHGRIHIQQRWHRNGEKTLFLFPFYYGRKTNIETGNMQFLYNIYYKNKASAKARWDYHYKGKKPFPETEWEFEKFRAEVFASLPSRQEKTYGFLPLWHGVYHENGNYANRFLLLAGNKKYKTFTGFDIMGELIAVYKENRYPFPNNRYNRSNREFYSHLLLFSKFTCRENYKREGVWQNLNSLYHLKNSRRSFAQKLPSIQEELGKLDKKKLPKEVVNEETFGLYLDEISKNYSFPTYKEYSGRVFPLFWYYKGEKRSNLVLPPLLTWSWRRGKEYNFHSLPLMTFLKRSPQEDRTTIMTPLAYYAKERRRKRSDYRIFPRSQKLVNEWGCAELRDRYAVCGLFYKGRFGFNVAKEGVDAKAADALRVALHNLHYEGTRLEKARTAILKDREKNQKWQTKNEIQRLEKLLQFEKLKKREKDLAGKEKEFRKRIDSALSHARKIRFAIKESAFRKRAESEKALAELMKTHTELRFYEDIGSGLFFHKQSYHNGDYHWHFLHLLAGGEKKGERESTHILHLLYRHRQEGKRSEKVFFPFITSIKDGENSRISFLYRVLSFHKKEGKRGGHILFIPFGKN